MSYKRNIQKISEINEENEIDRNYDIDINDVTIVVPTLNEEEAIGLVLNDLLTQGYEKILVVDGHSTDGTVKVVKRHRVEVIQQKGKGKTGAIATALEQIKTPYFVLIDGDCTYGAKDIEKMVPLMKDNLEVIGVRSSGRENISKFNRFGNWVINVLFNLLFGTSLNDVCSGMYMLKTSFMRQIDFETEGFDIEVEIAANAAMKGTVGEAPIDFFSRMGTQKLSPIRDGAKIISRIIMLGARLNIYRFISMLAMLLIFPAALFFYLPYSISIFGRVVQFSFIGLVLVMLSLQGLTIFIVDSRMKRNHRKFSLLFM